MIKLNKEIARELTKLGLGIFSSQGAFIGDAKLVIVYKGVDIYLAHISEFEQDGLFIRLKNED